MAVQKRLQSILELLEKTDSPISGGWLAEHFGVSRQIIVRDITRLRENGSDIISTPKGYCINRKDEITKVFKVHHNVEDTEKELLLIVDLGGEIKDVFIYHKIYGEIHAKLSIMSRKDVRDFCDNIKNGKSSPISTATAGFHYHTIVARNEETMKLIEKELKANGFLAEITEYEPESLKAKN